jgi:hypothetical protein
MALLKDEHFFFEIGILGMKKSRIICYLKKRKLFLMTK